MVGVLFYRLDEVANAEREAGRFADARANYNARFYEVTLGFPSPINMFCRKKRASRTNSVTQWALNSDDMQLQLDWNAAVY